MERDRLIAEMEKLTRSQRKALRRYLIGLAAGRDVLEVRAFEDVVTVFARKGQTKFWARMTPRGRIIEQKAWAA